MASNANQPQRVDPSDGEELADNYCKCIIIGGGIAGLSAASHLSAAGMVDFKLLEARNRLGGRIVTFQIAGTKAELGANWIHGILGNPLYELAVSKGLLNLVQTPKAQNVAATTEDGKRLPFSILQETYEAYFWFFKRCEEYFICKYQPPEGVKSVGEHIELEISIYLQRFPPQQRQLRRLVFDYLLSRECVISGCNSMNEHDLHGIGSFVELPGGNITLPRGFSSILQPIVASIPQDNILKGHAVKQIHWKYRVEMENLKNDKGYESDGGDSNSSNASVKTVKSVSEKSEDRLNPNRPGPSHLQQRSRRTTAANSLQSSAQSSVCNTPFTARQYPNVLIECENGEKFYTDYVICTVPLGFLKAKPTLFNPPLPKIKTDAMDRLNFGTVNKIYLEYDKPFLSPSISEVILLWDRVDESVEMKDKWFKKIYSFSKVSETVLLGWISGKEAQFMETLKMNVVADVCTATLRKFLNDPYVPKPKSCIFTAWHNQPYSLGSYTSIGVGGQQTDIERLAEPMFQRPNNRTPVLSFAGEHCHPSFFSTAHGAYLTGRSASQYYLNIAATRFAQEDEEDVYNLGAASVADLSTWLEEVSMGEKNLEDYKHAKKTRTSRRQESNHPLTQDLAANGASGNSKSKI